MEEIWITYWYLSLTKKAVMSLLNVWHHISRAGVSLRCSSPSPSRYDKSRLSLASCASSILQHHKILCDNGDREIGPDRFDLSRARCLRAFSHSLCLFLEIIRALHRINSIIPHRSKSIWIGKRLSTGLTAIRALLLNAAMRNRAFSRSFSLFLGRIRVFFAHCNAWKTYFS